MRNPFSSFDLWWHLPAYVSNKVIMNLLLIILQNIIKTIEHGIIEVSTIEKVICIVGKLLAFNV